MCCPGPDSCSGHRVIRYEHHFTTLNIHLPSLYPLSQSIPTLVRKQLQLNIFSVSLTFLLHIEQRHRQGTNPTPYRKPPVCPNTEGNRHSSKSWGVCDEREWKGLLNRHQMRSLGRQNTGNQKNKNKSVKAKTQCSFSSCLK